MNRKFLLLLILLTVIIPASTYSLHWLPPPGIIISGHSCSPDYLEIKIDAFVEDITRYNIYRDTLPMFYRHHYDSTHNFIGHIETDSMYFRDYFTDTLLHPSGSNGVCNPNINYYYIATSIDIIAGTELESQRPSNCVGEFDTKLYRGINWISYALDIGVRDAGEFASLIPGTSRLNGWDNIGQVWKVIARLSGFPPPSRWLSCDTVAVSYMYQAFIPSVTESLFTLAVPGLVPSEDPHFSLKRGRNYITLPYKEQVVNRLTTGIEFGQAIGYPPANRIMAWDAENQSYQIVARYIGYPPPAHWINGSEEWSNVRPGFPYMVECIDDRWELWPPISR